MRSFRRPAFPPASLGRCSAAVLTVPLLLCLTGTRTVFCSRLPEDGTAPLATPQQFYSQVLGDWVGTAVSRLNGDEPATSFFHLLISRVDGNTFREEYVFYRADPTTGVLERSGTHSVVSTIGSDAVIHQTCQGSGTILMNFKPKRQSFKASGEARSTGPHRIEAKARGKVTVEGLPLNLGKNGKLRKATSSWSLEDETLIGRTRAETSFRALFFTKRYCYETQLRAQRGADVKSVAGRAPIP